VALTGIRIELPMAVRIFTIVASQPQTPEGAKLRKDLIEHRRAEATEP